MNYASQMILMPKSLHVLDAKIVDNWWNAVLVNGVVISYQLFSIQLTAEFFMAETCYIACFYHPFLFL